MPYPQVQPGRFPELPQAPTTHPAQILGSAVSQAGKVLSERSQQQEKLKSLYQNMLEKRAEALRQQMNWERQQKTREKSLTERTARHKELMDIRKSEQDRLKEMQAAKEKRAEAEETRKEERHEKYIEKPVKYVPETKKEYFENLEKTLKLKLKYRPPTAAGSAAARKREQALTGLQDINYRIGQQQKLLEEEQAKSVPKKTVLRRQVSPKAPLGEDVPVQVEDLRLKESRVSKAQAELNRLLKERRKLAREAEQLIYEEEIGFEEENEGEDIDAEMEELRKRIRELDIELGAE